MVTYCLTLQAVALQARFLRIGGPSRGERVAKLNRLLYIAEEIGEENVEPWGDFEPPLLSRPPSPEKEEEETLNASKT